jgi:hypothetical protein
MSAGNSAGRMTTSTRRESAGGQENDCFGEPLVVPIGQISHSQRSGATRPCPPLPAMNWITSSLSTGISQV